jgi:multisubunit Na+/H+ antiporter MnhB subunit
MMASLIKKAPVSGIISVVIILICYGIEKSSKTEHPMFFFDLSIATISLILLVSCLVMLIGKLFKIFSSNYGIFIGSCELVNLLDQ